MAESIESLDALVAECEAAAASASAMADVEAARNRFLGRKGALAEAAKVLPSLPADARPEAGRRLNAAKAAIAALLDKAAARLARDARAAGPALDVTLPGRRRRLGARHLVSRVIEDCTAIFRRMGFTAVTGPLVETVWHNFDALNTSPDHPSRDEQDTFYLPDGRLLRTQTSTVQIRVMESRQPPIRVVSPGRCFRRDTPDATHSANFHQIEGLYIDRNVSLADLKGTLLHFARELLGCGVGIRLRPHFFPFTEPSVECDFSCILCGGRGCRICKNSGWLEIAGAGMVHPNVLANVGYDPDAWRGFAFGMGIERMAMIRHRVSDIRLFYENDIRFLRQF